MGRTLAALLLSAALLLTGCAANVAEGTATLPLDMADHQVAADEPPEIRQVTELCAALDVPADWDVRDDLVDGAVLIYAPYGATLDLVGLTWAETREAGLSRATLTESHEKFAYQLERDGDKVLRNEFEDDGETIRSSVAFVMDGNNGPCESWESLIYSDGEEARTIGFLPLDCTDAQRAEFMWVIDSLRLVSLRGD